MLLDFIIQQTGCDVFESYSALNRPLVQFSSSAAILEAFDGAGGVNLGLMLYAPEMRGRFRIRRFDLSRDLFPDEPWRETIEGWGLIQLELAGVRAGRLGHCHTNHNSETRAFRWEPTYPDFPPVSEWNFKAVTSISSRINRHVRGKLAVSKIGSRPVLAGAQALLDSGIVILGG